MRRRFEGMTLNRAVFWEVEQRGKSVVTTSGDFEDPNPKIHIRNMPSIERARDEKERLIQFITKQGYQEVSALRSDSTAKQTVESKHASHWAKVMCLTGVDYFSTLGYQPGIALLAAGILSPMATLIVVLVTLFCLLPLYSRVAEKSPYGQGSIAMLEHLLPGWQGKAVVLVLLGFAATDFVITMTLSAADAAAHAMANPAFFAVIQDPVALTILLLVGLGILFFNGFREAIGTCVLTVLVYLICNSIVAIRGVQELLINPAPLFSWQSNIFTSYRSFTDIFLVSALLFPKLALGMSGFETGVAVMPLVKSSGNNGSEGIAGRIANTKKLLTCAAVVMSAFLLLTSVITTVMIPPALYQEGGAANGRALAYLAHKFFGPGFGTLYDISTIAILWFAGASALAGLLALFPKYLPKYGMAPDWLKNQKPMVVFFTAVSLFVTWLFKANVDAQAGAYATGVLVLMSSAALAVFLSIHKDNSLQRLFFGAVFVLLTYTTITNIWQRPEGLQIGLIFIVTIVVGSLISRIMRSFELRIGSVSLDKTAADLVKQAIAQGGRVCLVAHRANGSSFADKEAEIRRIHTLTQDEARFIFLEVTLGDPSEFSDDTLEVTGHLVNDFKILRCSSSAIPNAIAAVLLHVRDVTKVVPTIYFGWTEGNPLLYVIRYIFFGEGETASLTREILREVDHDQKRRPRVIVG